MIRGEEQTVEGRSKPAWKTTFRRWLAVGELYEAEGVAFPLADVSWAVYGDDREWLWIWNLLELGTPEQIQERIDRARIVRDEIEDLRINQPNREGLQHSPDALDVLLEALEVDRKAALDSEGLLRGLGWRFDPDTKQIKQATPESIKWFPNPNPGPEDRRMQVWEWTPDENCTVNHSPRKWINEVTCRLHDALRPAFDKAWPDLAGTKVPGLLRTHIRQILGVFFHSEDLQDRLIENTIRNHIKT